MDKLPKDIINHILEYDGKIKYRNGMYINQILQNDKRYDMLQKIAPKNTYIYTEFGTAVSTENRMEENINYKTKVELSKYTLIFIENNPLWYYKTFIVCKCRDSKLYTKFHFII